MRQWRKIVVFLCVCVMGSLCHTFAIADDFIVVAKRINAAPVIDGQCDDACWQQARSTAPFMVLGKPSSTVIGAWEAADPKYSAAASTAMVGYDDQALYVAVQLSAAGRCTV